MKQNYYFRRILSAVFLLMASTLAWAYDFEAENEDGVTIYYNLINDGTEAEVTYYDSQWSTSYFDEVMRIPETVVYNGNTYRVTSIGDYAFYYYYNLTSVSIPDYVTRIGHEAFRACYSLSSITLSNSVTQIGNSAFAWCYGLPSITIPNSVVQIGSEAFVGCSGLASIVVANGNPIYDSRDNCNAIIETASNTLCHGCKNTIIPNTVTRIGFSAFYGTNLTSINIPNSVTKIDNSAFRDCYDLTSLSLGNGVTNIEGDAFAYCKGLTSLTIPNSTTQISNWAFIGCNSITSIVVDSDNPIYDSRDNCNAIVETASNTLFLGCSNTVIPHSITNIGNQAFYDCSKLTAITIPNSVTSIGEGVFHGCDDLASVIIPNSVTSIGEGAFQYCHSLTSITIPEGITCINGNVFNNCDALISIVIPKNVTSIANDAFAGCSSLVSVTIPDGVTSIGWAAFRDCRSLPSVTIPGSVENIDGEAFAYCSSLTSVISEIEDPFIIDENVFASWDWDKNIYSSAILYCPNPELYKETDGWNKFADIRPITGEEEVTLAIGDAHYATFMAPFNVEIPANVEAYTVSGIKEDGETLQMDRLLETIPANTPVVLYSPDIVNVTIKDTRTIQSMSYTYGLLTGVYTEIQAPQYSYVLQNQYDNVAFYYVYNQWNLPTITANHAYLTVPNANGIKALRFGNDDETTGIQATVSDPENKAVIYDMTGRRVEKAVKGMYIIDGKKVMVK